jgi:hypothetical protein
MKIMMLCFLFVLSCVTTHKVQTRKEWNYQSKDVARAFGYDTCKKTFSPGKMQNWKCEE